MSSLDFVLDTCIRLHCKANSSVVMMRVDFGLNYAAGIDLCLESEHSCEHLCESSPGSYTCHCLPGYRLNADGKTCSGKNITKQEAHLLFQIKIEYLLYLSVIASVE